MCGDRFSSSTTCSRWRHETEPGRLDQSLSCRFWKVATHPLLDLPGFKQVSTLSGLAEEEPTPPLSADEFEESRTAVVARLEKMLKRVSDDKEEPERTDPDGR